MTRKIKLLLNFAGGGRYEHELLYEGKNAAEIARAIQRDENALLEYMQTGDDLGMKAFVFQGFMFKKANIEAAQFAEPEF